MVAPILVKVMKSMDLTLGGVGSGTTIENVEIIANQDDGIEWFGGTS